MDYLNQHFFLSMKRFESQFAIYQKGGFYKKHLDQLKKTRHRQVSCILYLDDCLAGGELLIFNKNNKNQLDYTYTPKAGEMVLFFSKSIYHEVLPTQQKRYSLTTWFRDDEDFLNL